MGKTAVVTRSAYRLHSLLTLVLLLLLFAALAFASTRFTVQFDLTRGGRHSLSAASAAVLARMNDEITVTAYAREQPVLRQAIGDFIGKYQRVKPDLELRYINPDTVPDEVRDLGISVNGELVLQYQGRREHVREVDEGVFTNALLRLSRGGERWIAFVEGHGERSPLGRANHDLGEWARHLTNRGYNVQPLNLAESAVPDNTSALVLAGPRVPLLPGESETLLRYLEQGGNLLWLLDPEEKVIPRAVAEFLDVSIKSGTVIDAGGKLIGIDDPTVTMVTSSLYGQHPALNGFEYTTLFPGAAAIDRAEGGGWESSTLLTTSSHTWLETGPLAGKVHLDSDRDDPGPLTIGLSLERDSAAESAGKRGERQRVVIIGDGDFLSNTFLGNSGNLDLGVRIIDWLSREEDLIEVPARTTSDTQLNVSSITIGIIGIFFLLVFPLSFSATGLLVWWRRRRR